MNATAIGRRDVGERLTKMEALVPTLATKADIAEVLIGLTTILKPNSSVWQQPIVIQVPALASPVAGKP